jgi:hypothetical protein
MVGACGFEPQTPTVSTLPLRTPIITGFFFFFIFFPTNYPTNSVKKLKKNSSNYFSEGRVAVSYKTVRESALSSVRLTFDRNQQAILDVGQDLADAPAGLVLRLLDRPRQSSKSNFHGGVGVKHSGHARPKYQLRRNQHDRPKIYCIVK